MRKHFEEALRSCPRSRLLRLYTRYIRWTEENYPALGASADLGDLLFRCVRDTSHLEGVFTHPAYVDVWLKLIDYCDFPLELFSLLFTNGVGTLSAHFYRAWVDRLQRTTTASGDSSASGAKGANQIASILIHGLRAYAQPIETLESYAESFLHLMENERRLERDEHDFERITTEARLDRSDERRQKLGALRVVEAVTTGAPSNVPVIRTGNALDVSQRGLPSLQAQSAAPVRQRPASNLQVFRDEPTAAGNSGDRHPFLHTRAPAPNATAKAKALTRLADPLSNWHAENTKKEADFTLNPQTASLGVSNTTRPSGITPTSGSRGTLNIFQDATPSHHQQPLPPRVDSQAKGKKAERKPHGLRVQKQPLAETLSSAAPVPLLTLATLKSVLDTAAARGAGDDPKAHLLTVFFCDLDMLTTDSGEESCFEMNKAQNCHPDVCSTTLSAAPSWTDEAIEASERVLNEIRQIVEGEELDNPIVGSADESDGRKRARMELINRLEALNRSQTAATP
uniref:Mitotic checkpoint serine/threonine-protein kinase BUB1 beta n=1 Tax=Schistocephalus solidus TaxID=70667 RepID=A0A0V0J2Y8_SCHSO